MTIYENDPNVGNDSSPMDGLGSVKFGDRSKRSAAEVVICDMCGA